MSACVKLNDLEKSARSFGFRTEPGPTPRSGMFLEFRGKPDEEPKASLNVWIEPIMPFAHRDHARFFFDRNGCLIDVIG